MVGAVERVRPKMMTVVAIMAGLLPILWSTGTGSEVMQRIAVPMIGGMISSTILTLVVIPAVYGIVKGWRLPMGAVADAAASPAREIETRNGIDERRNQHVHPVENPGPRCAVLGHRTRLGRRKGRHPLTRIRNADAARAMRMYLKAECLHRNGQANGRAG